MAKTVFWRDLDPQELRRIVAWSKQLRVWRGWRWIPGHRCENGVIEAGESSCAVCW
jgi:hypothetical protein